MEENDTTVNDSSGNEDIVVKPRLSLFKPDLPAKTDDTLVENQEEVLYCGKLLTEKFVWKDLYQQGKEKNIMLKQQLQAHPVEEIDYSLFSEDELKCLGNQSNFTAFINAATDFIGYFEVFQQKLEKVKLISEIELKILEEKDNIIKEALIDLKH